MTEDRLREERHRQWSLPPSLQYVHRTKAFLNANVSVSLGLVPAPRKVLGFRMDTEHTLVSTNHLTKVHRVKTRQHPPYEPFGALSDIRSQNIYGRYVANISLPPTSFEISNTKA